MLGEEMNTVKKNTEASKEVDLDVNTEKVTYRLCLYLITRIQDRIIM
jgi:hypothetical protein